MAVAWTDITNAQVSAGAAVTTALMTALRDNPEGIAQRASGAPKIFGVPYDFQEFTTAGTWTKPSNAEAGDRVFIQVVGGGEAGDRGVNEPGGGGAAGVTLEYAINDLPSSFPIGGVGAGGAGTSGAGGNGGATTVGVALTGDLFIQAQGGTGNNANTAQVLLHVSGGFGTLQGSTTKGGNGASPASSATPPSENGQEGAGGGGSIYSSIGANRTAGAPSMRAGDGGHGRQSNADGPDGCENGRFPGGGGGAVRNVASTPTAGDGADGVVRVWCVKDA